MNNIKRVFALILTCAVIFSTLSGAIFTNTVAATPDVGVDYKRIEAETDGGYSVTSHHFSSPNQSNAAASGGKQVGDLNCDHDKIQSFNSLATYLDASNTANIAFTVKATTPGKYKVLPLYSFRDDVGTADYYMTLLVNGKDTYKVPYANNGSDTVNTTSIEIDLVAGSNVIKMIPVVAETKEFRTLGNWMNIDCLDVASSLTPVKPDAHSIKVGAVEYKANFNSTLNDVLSGDKSADAKKAGIIAPDITKDNLSQVSYFAYTFNVPSDGYYDIRLAFQTDAAWKSSPYYYSMIVNGVTYVVGALRDTGYTDSFRFSFIDLTAKLTGGNNTIVVTNNLALADASKEAVTQSKFETLTIYGGAIDAPAQIDPLTIETKIDYNSLSAVDYAAKHVFVEETANNRITLDGVPYLPTGNADAVAKIQSYDELANGATLSKSSLPYAAFHVTAAKAGTYKISPNMQLGTPTTAEASKENYFFTVSVNDKRYYKITDVQFGSFKNYEMDVELDAGVNVIRLIPFTRDSYANAIDISCIINSLDIQSTLNGVKAAPAIVYGNKKTTDGDNITAAAFSSIVNTAHASAKASRSAVIRDQFNNAGTPLINSYTPFVNGGRNYDNLTQDTLDQLAYIAHTFEVPADGYYDISFDYHTVVTMDKNASGYNAVNKGADGATGYFIARIDGKKVKVPFIEPVAVAQTKLETDEVPAANLSTYLTAGSHTILVSGAMDWSAPGFEKSSHRGTWLKSIEVNGGITVATEQKDPKYIPDEVTTADIKDKLEGEIFATVGGFDEPKKAGAELADFSSYGAVAGIKADSTKFQSYSSLNDLIDKTNTPYITFIVNANAAGTYTLKPVYRLTGTTSGYELAVTVNDEAAYKSAFVQGAKAGWNASTLEVDLEAGRNVIRVIPFTSENADVYADDCFYFDYLEIDDNNPDAVDAYGVLPQSVTVNAGDAHYIANFGNVSSASLGGANYETAERCKVTVENLDKFNFSNAPYFSYTVNAPADGYYDISLPITVGGANSTILDATKDYNIAIYVNEQATGAKFKVVDETVTNAKGIVNATIYLTAGDHALSFTSQLPWSEADKGNYGWTDFTTLTLNGGLTISNTPIDPVGDINRLEAEIYAEAPKYSAKESGAHYSGGYALGNGNYWGADGEFKNFPSRTEMEAGNYNKDLAHATFTVTSPADNANGALYVGYTLTGSNSDAIKKLDDPFIWVYVNGKAYKARLGQWIKNIEWQQGDNTVVTTLYDNDTFVEYQNDGAGTSSAKLWVNIDYLDLDETVTGKYPKSYTAKRFEAEVFGDCFSYSGRESGSHYSGGIAVSGGGYQTNMLYTEAEYLAGNYTKQPHIVFTVDVEIAGYYNMSMGYTNGTAGTMPSEFNTYIIVEDANGKRGYKQINPNTWADGIRLEAGTSKVILTVYDKETYAATGDTKSQTWMNIDYLDVHSEDYELNTSDVVSCKYPRSNTAIRLEAEEYGDCYNYPKQEDGDYSGGKAVSGGGFESNSFHTEAEYLAGEYTREPHIIFTTEVERAGYYNLSMGYNKGTAGTMPSEWNTYIIVEDANGKRGYKQVNPATWVENVWLEAGVSKIIVTIYDKETYDATGDKNNQTWMNIDYLDIHCEDFADLAAAGLTYGVRADHPKSFSARRFEAEDYGNAVMYPGTEKGNYSGEWAISQGQYVYGSFYSSEQYKSGKYEEQPYVLFKLDIEKAGYYNLSMGYSMGSGGKLPNEFNTYIIVKKDGVAKGYKQVNPATWINDVYLEAGNCEIILTIYDSDTLAKMGKKAEMSTWMNIDYLDVQSDMFEDLAGAGLTYGIRGTKPPSSLAANDSKYARFEAETDAYYNFYNATTGGGSYSGKTGRSSQSTENAQSKAELEANGLDVSKTPHVMYVINTDAAGDYEIRVGTAYHATSTSRKVPANYTGHFGVFVNDTTRAHAIKSFAVTSTDRNIATYVGTVSLKAGQNVIYVTGATSDTYQQEFVEGEGFNVYRTFVHQDYLDVQKTFNDGTRNITISAPTNVMEAEDSFMRNYTAEERGGASGNAMACRESFSKVLAENLTLEKLNSNPDYLAYAPYIEYEIIADEAGRYPVIFVGNSGRGDGLNIDNLFFGLAVENEKTKANGTSHKFDKVNYQYFGTSSAFSIIHWVEVEKGTNLLRLTGNLRDLVKAEGNLNWTDHDCVVLPKELHGVIAEIVPPGMGDEFMEVSGTPVTLGTGKIKPTRVYVLDDEGNELTDYTFRVRCESFGDDEREFADDLAKQLIEEGYEDVQVILVDGEYVVYVGKYDNLEDAEAMAAILYDAGYEYAEVKIVAITRIGDVLYGVETSPTTGENILLVLPMLLALAAITGMYAFFKTKKKKICC